MGQKINPISLRLQHTNRHFNCCWYSDYYYSDLISQDLKIQTYINSFFKQLEYPSARFFIQTFQQKTRIFILFCSPNKLRKARSKTFNIKNYSVTKKIKNKKENTLILTPSERKPNYKNSASIPFNKEATNFTNIGKSLYFRYILFYNYLLTQNLSTDKANLLLSTFLGSSLLKKKLKNIQNYTIKNNLEYNIWSSSSIKQSLTQHELKDLLNKPSTDFSTEIISTSLILEKPFLETYSKLNTNNFVYRKHLKNILHKQLKLNVDLYPIKVYNDFRSALFLAEEIVYYLERRVPFRKIKNKILREIASFSQIKGIRIACSGRVGGRSKKAQRAKTECIKYGQTSLHVFSSYIDFASKTAVTPFGSVGIKVWICFQ